MISISEVVAIFESAASMALILVLALKLWPSFQLDKFRQAMFVIRDELFDFAVMGGISFDHPSYKLLRQSMNGFIRYAHQLTFFRLVCTLLRWKVLREQPALTWAARWQTSLDGISDEATKAKLQAFHVRAVSLVVRRLITGSPVLMFALLIMVSAVMLRTHWGSLKQVMGAAAEKMVKRIVDTRLLEEEAANA